MTESAPTPRRLVRAEQVLAARTRRVAVVLEGSQDPHNVHAVLRTAEALGVQDIHLVAPRGEAAVIAPGVTQRAHEWLTIRRHADIDAALAVARAEGREVWAAANVPGAEPLTGLVAERPVAVVLGNESEGLSARALAAADRTFRIDLVGFSGSLNLSVAAGIVLWELRRLHVVRRPAGDLAEGELAALRQRWYPRLLAVAREEDAAPWLARTDEIRAEALAAERIIPADRERPTPPR